MIIQVLKSFMFNVFALTVVVSTNTLGQKKDYVLVDMVHNNPGEPKIVSNYNDPSYLKLNNYNAIVYNDFIFADAALTYDSFDKRIFPEGSLEREWVKCAEYQVAKNIKRAHDSGIKAYYFTDLIVLPKKLVQLYKNQICDQNGKISLDKPETWVVLKALFQELFTKFPALDGLVIRTGEIYLNNVPYHTGNNPITKDIESEIKLINFLRDQVCVKYNKQLFYRTWASGGMDTDTAAYLKVTNNVPIHPNLYFCIKHTQGDYHRTFSFNPTIGIGKHQQIVEVECQREYEGKGAFPNYIADGVINGFEELLKNKSQTSFNTLDDVRNNKLLSGVWTWSRGGGWVGPYINNEFWCSLNAYVISNWWIHPQWSELNAFDSFMDKHSIYGVNRKLFRDLCLLSAQAVLRGHNSAKLKWQKRWVWWTRDQFLGGTDSALRSTFETLYKNQQLFVAVNEKYDAVKLWQKIVDISNQIDLPDEKDEEYIKISSEYGLLLHRIIADGWKAMALGFMHDEGENIDINSLKNTLVAYDCDWEDYNKLNVENSQCATLYKPFGFKYKGPTYQSTKGMGPSINKYRELIN